MRNIIFNLLERASRHAGCSGEAWEVVLEFASVKLSLGEGDALDLFAFPAEAMLKCFSEDGDDEDADRQEDDAASEWPEAYDPNDSALDDMYELRELDNGGFGGDAFANLRGRFEVDASTLRERERRLHLALLDGEPSDEDRSSANDDTEWSDAGRRS